MDYDRKLKAIEERVQELESWLEAVKHCVAIVELDGFGEQIIYGTGVPPVGATFEAHKHTTDGGTYTRCESQRQIRWQAIQAYADDA